MSFTQSAPARQFFHGTRADLRTGERIEAGFRSNYGARLTAPWVYFSGTLDAAIWGAELAAGDGRERIYLVQPTGPFFDDPNLTDKKFPGNPTCSYRSRDPLIVLGEITQWRGHSAEERQRMQDFVARMAAEGIEAID